MSRFRTRIDIQALDVKFDYRDKLFFTGSCFSENLGRRMKNDFFNCLVNPFGVLYNPVSIARSMRLILGREQICDEDILFHNGLYHSSYHSGLFSGPNKNELQNKIDQTNSVYKTFLKESKFLFITFGTARVYKYLKSGKIVANCHKIPGIQFTNYLCDPDEIAGYYNELIPDLYQINPDLNIVFTVSPVRHWKDGAHGNQLSKSVLQLSIQKILEQNPDCMYFPSYEIVMDELRDYRFYARDMIHVSEETADYLYEAVAHSFFSNETQNIRKEVLALKKVFNHKILHPGSEEHKRFLKKKDEKLQQFKLKYPFVKVPESLTSEIDVHVDF